MNRGSVNSGTAVIEFRNVTKRYGRLAAVDDVSFRVEQGEVCGFLGPNGAGKTTSLRMLLGLVRPTSGEVLIDGVNVRHHSQEALSGVGAIIEESRFYPYLTGEQNLRQVLRLRQIPAGTQQIRERLSEAGLNEAGNRRVKGYSLGMRQRLALALAMLQNPRLLILDEPMNGLDPAAIREFRLHLLTLAQSGVTVLLSSHILSEVEQLATKLVFIRRGRVMGMEDRLGGPQETYVRARRVELLDSWLNERGFRARPQDDGRAVALSSEQDVSSFICDMVNSGIELLEIRPYSENLERQYLQHMSTKEGRSFVEA